MTHKIVKSSELQNYMMMSAFDMSLYSLLQKNGQTSNFSAEKDKFLRHEMLAGNWEACGRLKIDGYLYEHEIIPKRKWKHLDTPWGTVKFGGDEYFDVHLRQIKKRNS